MIPSPVHAYDSILCGLALDLAGAVLLAKGFMLKRPEDLLRETRLHFGRIAFLVKGGLYQTVEARAGGLFLILGFLAQLAALA